MNENVRQIDQEPEISPDVLRKAETALKEKRIKFEFPTTPGIDLRNIEAGVKTVLGCNLVYDETTDTWHFWRNQKGIPAIHLYACNYYHPTTLYKLCSTSDGRLYVTGKGAAYITNYELTLDGTIQTIGSGSPTHCWIQNMSAVNVVLIGGSAVSDVGFLELQPKQIFYMYQDNQMYVKGTVGQKVCMLQQHP